MGASAFDGCTDRVSLKISNKGTSLGASAFEQCRSLTSIVIPDGVTSIGAFAFAYCSSLASIVIPNSTYSNAWNTVFLDSCCLENYIFPEFVDTANDFNSCSGTTSTGSECADVDFCDFVDCGAGATCTNTLLDNGSPDYTCECSPGFEGNTATRESAICTEAWTIESSTPAVTATFEAESTSEIIFNFTKTFGRAHKFGLYAIIDNEDGETAFCDMNSPVVLSKYNEPFTTLGSTAENGVITFSVGVDIDVTDINNNDAFSADDSLLSFCARVDLYYDMDGNSEYTVDDVGVSFLEVPVKVFLDLTEGFEIVSINLLREDAAVVTEEASVEYALEACQCEISTASSSPLCRDIAVQPTINQNQVLNLCVNTLSTDVEIERIQSLRIKQVSTGDVSGNEFIYAIGGGTSDNPNNDGSVSSLTIYDSTPAQLQTVQTRLVSAFFPNQDVLPDLEITGQALLKFSTGRRHLADLKIKRNLQEQEATFQLTVEVAQAPENDEAQSDMDVSSCSNTMIAGAVLVASCVAM
jgi:hypothetical protein